MLEVVLRALEHAHESGLVHRDVSPANIMLDTDARGCIAPSSIRLLDFGLADAAGAAVVGTDDLLNMHATGRAGVLGNVGYMSPEHVRGEAVDARGDIYQAGAVLYFALTGRAPFVRETIDLTMRAHLAAPPPVPSVTDRRIPRDLDRIVVRALLKNPEDRFATASDMRRALTERHNAPGENAGAAAATATIPPPAAPSRAEVTRVLATAPPIRRTDGGGSSAFKAAAPTAAPRGRFSRRAVVRCDGLGADRGDDRRSRGDRHTHRIRRRATPSGVQPRAGRQRAHRHRRVTRRAHSAARSPARGTRPDASVSCRGRTGLADRGIRGGGDPSCRVRSPGGDRPGDIPRRRDAHRSWRSGRPGGGVRVAHDPRRGGTGTRRGRRAAAGCGVRAVIRLSGCSVGDTPGNDPRHVPLRGNPACHRNGDHRLRSGATDSDGVAESHSRRPDTHHHPDTGRRGKSRCRSVRRSTVVLRPADAACSSSPRTVAEAVNPDPGHPAHTRRTPMAVSSRGEESA